MAVQPAGVSTRSTNVQSIYADLSFSWMTGKQDWIVFPASNAIYTAHAGQFDRISKTIDDSRYRVVFDANPVDGAVRVSIVTDATLTTTLLLTASTADRPTADAPAFDSLRPCVVLACQQNAVVRSGVAG
jgi:hypothetical protein